MTESDQRGDVVTIQVPFGKLRLNDALVRAGSWGVAWREGRFMGEPAPRLDGLC